MRYIWHVWHPSSPFPYVLFFHSEYVARTGKPCEFEYSWQVMQANEEVCSGEKRVP